ncbi:Sec-independent protein translocase protein TatB [Pelagibaculum spongiae]|uniref:Sec-independent protein translocase protein TatB n=1 Tax=Pelagibaculum spongiae TaxID=2080658 RepID=A0A2V1GSZ1_9GAMM|nr:Sec-independent protein translocase protein TatB [Pelagibaculum spongiae]PVZ68144.1 twin-arginine translocase subunit TatB [Pelagibaculum spongiae]
MFDIGFWELALLGIICLLVVGPERLPAFARAVGNVIGKVKRTTGALKSELDRELRNAEVMAKSNGVDDIRQMMADTQKDLEEATRPVKHFTDQVSEQFRDLDSVPEQQHSDLQKAGAELRKQSQSVETPDHLPAADKTDSRRND